MLHVINRTLSILIDSLTHSFHIFIVLIWRWAMSTFKIVDQSLVTFETWIPFKYLYYIMKGFFKHFIKSLRLYSRGENETWWKLCCFKSQHLTLLEWWQIALQHTLKCQLHKNAKFCNSDTHHMMHNRTQKFLVDTFALH